MGKNALLSFTIKSVTKRPVMVSKYITTLTEKNKRKKRTKKETTVEHSKTHLPSTSEGDSHSRTFWKTREDRKEIKNIFQLHISRRKMILGSHTDRNN